MSLYWTLIAGFLYAEIALLFLLILPFISTRMWHKIFKSRMIKSLENQLVYYFYVLVAILVLFFVDSIREMRKYNDEQSLSEQGAGHANHLDVQMQLHLRLFRAQRNFYISGFALFLSLVIRRMVTLISVNSTLEVEREAAMKQATSASRAAEALLNTGDNSEDKKKVEKLENELKETKAALKSAQVDVESMRTQAKNLSQEYDRLTEEHNRLERQLKISGSADGDKKDD